MSIDSIKHNKKRAHIPSKEEAGYEQASEKVNKGKDTLELPLNPVVHRGQDPELFWLDKYKNDNRDELLELDIRSLYRHEHVAPETLIAGLYKVVEDKNAQPDLFSMNDLFGNALEHEELEKVSEYYQHSDGWTNRLIQGDSLLVMASLLEREGMAGQVQTIYMDPPYGIKYGSNWQMKLNDRNVKDGADEHLTGEPEQVKAFRDTWELGIHSYLSYLRDRLLVAKELLTESGSVFVQISDENVHLVRNVMDEVFGSGNYITTISFQTSGGKYSKTLPTTIDYLLWYAKDFSQVKYHQLYVSRRVGHTSLDRYDYLHQNIGTTRRLTKAEIETGIIPSSSKRYKLDVIYSTGETTSESDFQFEGQTYKSKQGTHWKTTLSGMYNLAKAGRINKLGRIIMYKRYEDDFAVIPIHERWENTKSGVEKLYVVQTANSVIERCLLMTTDPGDLVLDPTCVRKGTLVFTPPNPPVHGGGQTPASTSCMEEQIVAGGCPPPRAGGLGGVIPIEAIQPNDYVYAHDGKPHRVLRTIHKTFTGNMLGIHHTLSNKPLWLTPDHRVLTKTRRYTFSGNNSWQHNKPSTFEKARLLRNKTTKSEQILWASLKGKQLGVKFRRQHPIGYYIVDFFCRERALVIEIDGDSHFTPEARQYDAQRTTELQATGLKVIRFTNQEIFQQINNVLSAIQHQIGESVQEFAENAIWLAAENLRIGDTVFYGHKCQPVQITKIDSQQTTEEVYDLEVENAHSFITEQCIVHNCGSGTTAYVAEQWGRRWITTDTSRIALNIAKQRLMTATFPYYKLYDEKTKDIRQGFKYKEVPHVTLKAIANNAEIDTIHAKWQKQLEPMLAELNKRLKQNWPEWEVSREPDPKWPKKAQDLLADWWKLRQQRQQEIDASIAHNSDSETLYDQPFEEKKKLRVAGPFTVETLQDFEPINPENVESEKRQENSTFEERIFAHLKSAGVKNGIKNEQAIFIRVEHLADSALHAEGFYLDASQNEKKAYFHIGPKFGTVTKQAVNQAIKACRQRGDADWLIILGFSFESDISNQNITMNIGTFEVTKVRMHDDLLQSGLYKKDKKAAAFITIGEPDVKLHQNGKEAYVEIQGLDIYDPIKDIVKARNIEDIAYWMVDNDYDDSNFVVRQVFFCGGKKEEFKKWQKGLETLAKTKTRRNVERTLKIEIDEEAFDKLYGFKSHVFAVKPGQKIAVRVISQFGEESTKVIVII